MSDFENTSIQQLTWTCLLLNGSWEAPLSAQSHDQKNRSCKLWKLLHHTLIQAALRTLCLFPFPPFSLVWFPLFYPQSPMAPFSWSNAEMSGWAEYKGCGGVGGREWRKSPLQLTLPHSSLQSMSSVKYKHPCLTSTQIKKQNASIIPKRFPAVTSYSTQI